MVDVLNWGNSTMSLSKRLSQSSLGTCWLVFAAAVPPFAAAFLHVGIICSASHWPGLTVLTTAWRYRGFVT